MILKLDQGYWRWHNPTGNLY